MSIRFYHSCDGVDFQEVSDLLELVGLSHGIPKDLQELSFRRSYAVTFIYDTDPEKEVTSGRLIGCGRALSDGISQAAIYNIAIHPDYHGGGLGRKLIESLLEQVRGCNTILYTHPKTVAFYEKLGFRRQKTGFVIANGSHSEEAQKWLEDTGFFLPEGYRFENDESELYDDHGELIEKDT